MNSNIVYFFGIKTFFSYADENDSGKIFYDKLINKMKEEEDQALLNFPPISASSTVSSGLLEGKSEENLRPSRERKKVMKLPGGNYTDVPRTPRNLSVVGC